MNEARNWLRQRQFSPLQLCVLVGVGMVFAGGGAGFQVYRLAERQFRPGLNLLTDNPLRDVQIADDTKAQGMTVFRKPYSISKDWASQYVPLWEKVYVPFRGKPDVNYLEIGAFEGGSLVWMLENILTDPSARATAIDIFTGDHKDTYFQNIELSGSAQKVTTITDFSQRALRGLPWNSFDIVYVDGSHVPHDVLEDAVLSWRLLKKGGLMVFDNYRTVGPTTVPGEIEYPQRAIDPFVLCYQPHCEVIHKGEQLIIRKKV